MEKERIERQEHKARYASDPEYRKQVDQKRNDDEKRWKEEAQAKYNALSPEQKLRLQVDVMRENDDRIRRSKGLPPKDKEHYDNLYRNIKNY